jgi:CRP-like cAMP-binding protein
MELAERLSLVGLATEAEFRCPLSQFVLADALGLTSIHVNRTLRQLRERKLLTVRRGVVTIHDLAGLRELAGFQGGYLNSHN